MSQTIDGESTRNKEGGSENGGETQINSNKTMKTKRGRESVKESLDKLRRSVVTFIV